MNILFIMIIEFLIIFPIICTQTFLCLKTIGLSEKWRGLRLVFVVFSVTVVEAALQLVALRGVFVWAGFLAYVVIIFYPVFFMGGKLKERLFLGIINCVLFLFSSLLSVVIVYTNRTNMPVEPWQILLISILIFFINAILALVIAHLNTEGKRYIPPKYWIVVIISFSFVLVAFFVSVNIMKIFIVDDHFRIYLSIFSLIFFIVWILMYFVFYFICRFFSKVIESNALAIQNDMIERYMLRKQASEERIRILSHDLKHSLIQWRELAEENHNTNALQSISEYEEQLQSSLLFNVENENANAIINQKYWEAAQAQVEFLVNGVFHNDLLIGKLDLCSLLGNLLDNAIDAAAKAETLSLRIVKLYIHRKGKLLMLTVENGYSIEPILKNGLLVTSKADKSLHSIGMRSIQYVAEKYDGGLRYFYENNWFKATVMLRGYLNVLSNEN